MGKCVPLGHMAATFRNSTGRALQKISLAGRGMSTCGEERGRAGSTDKGTAHSYFPVYEALFTERRLACRSVLEIGVQGGGSMYLWQEYFPNAQIVGVDIAPRDCMTPRARAALGSRTTFIDSTDAYTPESMRMLEKLVPSGYDIIVDDGPHTLESQKWAAREFPSLLSERGCLVIEDIVGTDNAQAIVAELPASLRPRAEIIDRRAVLGRFDDVLVAVDKLTA